MGKTLKIGVNKQNERIALISNPTSYEVYIERENYSNIHHGGTVKVWKRIKQCSTLEEAEQIFKRRANKKVENVTPLFKMV